jgi:hypothetical protein
MLVFTPILGIWRMPGVIASALAMSCVSEGCRGRAAQTTASQFARLALLMAHEAAVSA